MAFRPGKRLQHCPQDGLVLATVEQVLGNDPLERRPGIYGQVLAFLLQLPAEGGDLGELDAPVERHGSDEVGELHRPLAGCARGWSSIHRRSPGLGDRSESLSYG